MKPAAAAVLALSTFIVTHVVGWVHVFECRIPWAVLRHEYSILLTLYLALIAVGWFTFHRRDLKP